jgi:hypothetical protein
MREVEGDKTRQFRFFFQRLKMFRTKGGTKKGKIKKK